MKDRHLNVLVPGSWQDCSLLCGECLYWESPECVGCLLSLLIIVFVLSFFVWVLPF